MRLLDISLGLGDHLPVWPGDVGVSLERVMRMTDGDVANVSRLSCGVHAGTHVDAPVHFLADGTGVDRLPLSALVGPALVVDLPHADTITTQHLAQLGLPEDCERVLFKTRNSKLWAAGQREFDPAFVALTGDAASWLVERRIRLVGVDYLSVAAPCEPPELTHGVLLRAGVVILEGIDLHQVEPGPYQLVCLPLKLPGSDGAPARAILLA